MAQRAKRASMGRNAEYFYEILYPKLRNLLPELFVERKKGECEVENLFNGQP